MYKKKFNVKCNNSKCTKFTIKSSKKRERIWDWTYNVVTLWFQLSKQLLTLHLHLGPNQSFNDFLNV